MADLQILAVAVWKKRSGFGSDYAEFLLRKMLVKFGLLIVVLHVGKLPL